MRAAIYCRVSTEDQEREGTSLDSQLEACLKKADELGYEVPEEFIILETYSGLTLDRPKLPRPRQWVRDKEVDAVIAYTLDRLSRDPVHFIILHEEMDKASVKLILVTETVDSPDLGKLITHIKGYAAKLETEKIKERTTRGKLSKAKEGKQPGGRPKYGYKLVDGRHVVEPRKAEVIRMVFDWLVRDGMSLRAIQHKLIRTGSPLGKVNRGGNV